MWHELSSLHGFAIGVPSSSTAVLRPLLRALRAYEIDWIAQIISFAYNGGEGGGGGWEEQVAGAEDVSWEFEVETKKY